MVEGEVDGEPALVLADPAPTALVSVTLRELTAIEAMDADDLALAMCKTGNPAIARIIKTYAVCAIVAIRDAKTPMGESVSPKNPIEFGKLCDRLGFALVDAVALEYRKFSNDLEKMLDPKTSPAVTPSDS